MFDLISTKLNENEMKNKCLMISLNCMLNCHLVRYFNNQL